MCIRDSDYTGQQYKDTVEDLISREILPMTNGNTTKFHGSEMWIRDRYNHSQYI